MWMYRPIGIWNENSENPDGTRNEIFDKRKKLTSVETEYRSIHYTAEKPLIRSLVCGKYWIKWTFVLLSRWMLWRTLSISTSVFTLRHSAETGSLQYQYQLLLLVAWGWIHCWIFAEEPKNRRLDWRKAVRVGIGLRLGLSLYGSYQCQCVYKIAGQNGVTRIGLYL